MTKRAGTSNGLKIASSINAVGRSGQVHAKSETRPPTYTMHQNELKCLKDLNINHDTIKVLEENIDRKISDILHSNIFTNMSPRARDIKERINKWDLIRLKSFCMAKENSIKMKREPTIWVNIFANDTSDKGLVSKNSHNSTPGRQTIYLKMGKVNR